MSELTPCPACQRHVAVHEVACPFCAAALVPAARDAHALPGRLSRAALFAGALTASACSGNAAQRHDQPPPPPPPPADPVRPSDAITGDGPAATGTGRIRGRVLVDGQPHPYIGVSVRHVATGKTASAQTDMQGIYVIDGLAPGDYRLTAVLTNEREPPVEAHLTVRAGETTTHDMAGAHEHRSINQPYGAPPARRRVV